MASSSSTSSPSLSWNHDVFLSFRGEDTRKTFVDHLYTSLEDHGIHTYKDDVTLAAGDSIGPALLKAIRESRIAIIIFSENYATSSWCLDELAYIMECMEKRGQIVLPIFYHVDPSDIRYQKGKYKEAFVKHEIRNKNKVESWRKALFDAGNLSGWVPEDTANGHESKFIKGIVNKISDRLYSLLPSANEDYIGIVTRVHNLKMKLELGSGGVLMIGIWGVGGSGKTTLASCLYDDISGKFDGCCFLGDIRAKSSKAGGLVKLQEKIIYKVLKQKKVDIGRVEEGKRMIKSNLFHRKVLIVLDDADDHKQLEALAGSHDWFGQGSRIIITTREENLLNSHAVDMIHHTSLLNDEEAIELFCKRAPRNGRNVEDYELLSKGVVSYAGGLPLALIVLGSFLCDKDVNEWRSALARLKEVPNASILETLKISYDGLKQVEKTLFLDIACFFRGTYKNEAMEIFDACGLHPVIGIKVLIQKALITISHGCFEMHDLIQEMGHYIVKGDHLNNPENHSRIWEKKHVQSIWGMDTKKELDKIEALSVSSYMYDSLPSQNNQVVANMKKLRWIDWNVGRGSSFSRNFPPWELRCLIMKGRQTQLWKGYKFLPNLRMIKLQAMDYLIATPNFGGLPNLETFMLHTSRSIKEIHPSLEGLERLVYLSVEYCSSFKKFPSLNVIKKLETLIISNCSKLSNSWKEVASSEQYRTNLFVTCLQCCCGNAHEGEPSDDVRAPFLIHKGVNHVGLQFISRCLRKLILRRCNFGDEDIDCDVWDLPNLQELDLSLNLFSRLNFSILKAPRLKWLDVSECTSLVELSGLPLSLSSLRADGCKSLNTVGDTTNCKWLWYVSFFGRTNGVSALGGDTVLHSLLEGYAIEDHFISFIHSAGDHIPKRFVDRLVRGKTFTLQLPPNWYNDYSGFLICNVNNYYALSFTISMKQDLDKDSRSEVWQESDEAPESYFYSIYVGYVSFNSLMRHGARLNSAYNMISFSTDAEYETSCEGESRFVAELVPRKSKDDHGVQTTKVTTDCSQFFDDERVYGKTFTIQRHSESSIKILWRPCYWY
ncbi:putative TIR domain, P-loop containing nucleoside triphosphate hydrolase [Helianthus debilis subsp. tardiflorus]